MNAALAGRRRPLCAAAPAGEPAGPAERRLRGIKDREHSEGCETAAVGSGGGPHRGANRRAEARRAKLSVVLCTFEGERWLAPMLRSLLEQTRPPDELIVQDDGSTDETVALLEAFARRAPFAVSLEINRRRLGPTRNFEQALRRSSGALVALADQDDRWDPGKLQRAGELLDEDPTASLLLSDADLIDAEGRPIRAAPWPWASGTRSLWQARGQARHLRAHPIVAPAALGRQPICTGCTMVVRRRALDLALPFPDVLDDPAAPMGHDRWIALVASTVGTVIAIDERPVAYRVHDDQATGLDRPMARAGRLATTAADAVVGRRARFDRAALVRAQQLDAAADRGRLAGDHEAADELAALAQHHRRRAAIGERPRGRLRGVLDEARAGGYGRDRAGAAAMVADLARAIEVGHRRAEPR